MEIYSTEEQQVEAIKSWWLKNGKYFALALIVVIAGMVGVMTYKKNVIATMEKASTQYQQLSIALDEQGVKEVSNAEQFIAENPKSGYSDLLSLELAKIQVNNIQYDQAIATLEKLVSQTTDINMKSIALLRMARIQVQQNDLNKALTTLNKIDSATWKNTAEELRGDIYLSQGKRDDARQAYLKAQQDNSSPTLQLKLDDLI